MFDRLLLKIPGMRLALVLLLICSCVEAFLLAGWAYALANALGGLWAGLALAEVLPSMLTFFLCFACGCLVSCVRDLMLNRYARNSGSWLRARLLQTIFEGDAAVRAHEGTAALADSSIEGVERVVQYVQIIPPKLADMLVLSIAVLASILVFDWVSCLILVALLPVAVLFMVLIGKAARQRATSQYARYRAMSNHFIDTLRGLRTLRVFGVAKRYASTVFEMSEKFRRATMRTLGVATLSGAVLDLVSTAGVAAVAIMLGFRLMDSSLSLPTALFVLILTPEFFKPIRAFASDFHASLDGRNALADMFRIIEQTDPRSVKTGGASSRHVEPDDIQNDEILLHLHGVSFEYPDATPALRDINLDFAQDELVAIVGKSGAGKSTLVDILGGFKTPSKGFVQWGTHGAGALNVKHLQEQVMYIPQHPYIFHATLRDNIAFYKPSASDAEIVSAASRVGLDTMIAELEDGLDTVIGESSRGISGGQAHRIAFARALLDEGRRILLLDEPTEHLDIQTELELKEQLLPLMRGRLVVLATHRLHWLGDCNRVIFLDEGRVAAQGSYAELIADNEAFASFASSVKGGDST